MRVEFFLNVHRYKSADKPPVFDVHPLLPDKDDLAMAEKLAAYFNVVGKEFSPLEPDQIPTT